MADEYLDRVAGELADLAMADEKRSGDDKIINEIAEVLGASSQTLQEGFLTAVRVRRAEARARAILAERALTQVVEETPAIDDPQPEPKPEPQPKPQAAQQQPPRAKAQSAHASAGPKKRSDVKSKRVDLDAVEDAAFEEVDPNAPLKQRATPKSTVSPVRPDRRR